MTAVLQIPARYIRISLSLAALLWLAKEASAAPVTLNWLAPAECPQKLELSQRLNGRAYPQEGIAIVFTGAVSKTESGIYQVKLKATQGELVIGSRELSDPNCESLSDAVLVYMLLLLPKDTVAVVEPVKVTVPRNRKPQAPSSSTRATSDQGIHACRQPRSRCRKSSGSSSRTPVKRWFAGTWLEGSSECRNLRPSRDASWRRSAARC